MDAKTATLAVAVVAILAGAAYLGFAVLPGSQGGTKSTCSNCSQTLVVDVVMPALGTSGNFTNPNRVVNMSAGESKTLEVDVYPTAALVFAMSFGTVLAPGSGTNPGVNATFNPTSIAIGANAKGTTEMTLAVAMGAPRGTYDVVVSATNQANSTEVWGLYFEISVA